MHLANQEIDQVTSSILIFLMSALCISVHNPLTPGNITSFTDGAAGLCGEALKDAKHFSEVEGTGAVFIPPDY